MKHLKKISTAKAEIKTDDPESKQLKWFSPVAG